MATGAYLNGRRRYSRPQAILWANNSGTLSEGLYVPTGLEVGADTDEDDQSILDQFIVLSDHNRSEMQFTNQRIEQRQRTINGRMRSYHIADKLNMSVSWNMLPSRSYNGSAMYDLETGLSPNARSQNEYTVDGGAGGVELLGWYESHPGPFWMYLAYDKYNNFGATEEDSDAAYKHLAEYNQVIQVYISDFSYTVVNRGANNHDLWNISVTLEEV